MSKANIQTTTRELKEQSKALLDRIKTFQEEVTASYKEIRAAEASLNEKLREEKRAQAESSMDRMTAFVMPDDPEAARAGEEPEAHQGKPAARAAEIHAERAPLGAQPSRDARADRGPRAVPPQRDAARGPYPPRDGARGGQSAQTARPLPGRAKAPAARRPGKAPRPDRPRAVIRRVPASPIRTILPKRPARAAPLPGAPAGPPTKRPPPRPQGSAPPPSTRRRPNPTTRTAGASPKRRPSRKRRPPSRWTTKGWAPASAPANSSRCARSNTRRSSMRSSPRKP